MTAITSSSASRAFALPSFVTYVAMAPLLFTGVPSANFWTHVDLRPPQRFVLADGALLEFPMSAGSSPSQMIESIELQLGLCKAAVADILGVTRTSLYAWMEGKPIRPKNAERLVSLRDAARLLTRAAGGVLPVLWQYQTLPTGESFAEGVRAGGNPIEFAKMLADQWQQNGADSALLSTIFGE